MNKMNKAVTLLFLAFSIIRPLQADWKNNLSWATGAMTLISSYNLYTKATILQTELMRPQVSFNQLFDTAQKANQLAACRVAAGLSFIVGCALLSLPSLWQSYKQTPQH